MQLHVNHQYQLDNLDLILEMRKGFLNYLFLNVFLAFFCATVPFSSKMLSHLATSTSRFLYNFAS